MGRKAVGKLLTAAMLAGLVVLGPGVADAGVTVKSGKYNGKTDQDAISTAFRRVQFTVKKGKVKLITEPTVAREACVSSPVFTLGGSHRDARSSGVTAPSPSPTPSSAARSTRSTAAS